MFLLLQTSTVSSWFQPLGFKASAATRVTRDKIKDWYIAGKRGVVEGSNPLIALGVGSKVTGVVLGACGIKVDNKFLEWLGVGLGVSGLVESITGAEFVYKVLGEAKRAKNNALEKTEPEKKDETVTSAPPTVTEIHHHHYYNILPTTDREDLTVIEEQAITTQDSSFNELASGIINILTTYRNFPDATDGEKSNARALVEITDIGTNQISTEDLRLCLKENNRLIRLWALTCLLNKEDKDLETANQAILELGNQIDGTIWDLARELLMQPGRFSKGLVASTGDSEKIKTRILELMKRFKASN